MKYFIKSSLFIMIVAVILSACDKVGLLPHFANGTAVTLTSSVSTVKPTVADSTNTVITFSWTNPHYATDSATQKFVLLLDSTGRNFSKAVSYTITGALNKGIKGRDLNNILLNFGFALGSPYVLDAKVLSSYGNNNEQYVSNVLQITVSAFNDSSTLKSTNSSVSLSLANAGQLANTFNWSASFTGYTGNITYSIQYDSAGKKFVSPTTIAVGNNILTLAMLQSDMNTSAIGSGIAAGSTGSVEYRVKAVTANGAVSYSNAVVVSIKSYLTALYLVGGDSPAGWDPTKSTPMIADPRFPGTFYCYATLTPGNYGIKFVTSQDASWPPPVYGDANSNGTSGTLTSSGGGNNIIEPSAGIYRVTADLVNNKYYLQTGAIGGVGLVGDFQGWSPAGAIKMANPVPNYFVEITNMTNGNGFKFHDGNDWTNSTVLLSRWYALNNDGSVDPTGNAGNFTWTGATGPVRAIFDYTNITTPKYSLSPAAGMWVIGSAAGAGTWSPTDPTLPALTYKGNGVWSGSVTVTTGQIKFIVLQDANHGWDFNYGGAGGMLSVGGANISVNAGTYTVTVNEYTGTYTIQ